MRMDRFHRQRGLVDQRALMSTRVLISGSADGVGELFVMLRQLGVGVIEPGSIGIVTTDQMPASVFWKLMYGEFGSWEDWREQTTKGRCSVELIPQGDIVRDDWDIHLTLEEENDMFGDVNGLVNGMCGIVTGSIPPLRNIGLGMHPIHAAMRTVVAATLVNEALKVIGIRNSIPVSEVWLTVSCRIETADQQLARDHVRGVGGVLLDVSPSQDGLATIARYRYPIEHDIDTNELIAVEKQEYALPEIIDVGFIPWDSDFQHTGCEHSVENEEIASPASNVSILGVGGLGSWATPLICQALHGGVVNIIDGDDEIEMHNLNRQVLYREQDIGGAKATVAASRLSELFPHLQFNSFETFLRRAHVGETSEEGIDLNELFSDSEGENGVEDIDEELRQALKTSQIYLGCLDNMQARTILNEVALKSEMPMINGGGESIHGVVERLHDEGCMVCRYGTEVANAPEVISCTEEGARPITSIVTTTAYVGAMMAALTILELSGSIIHHGMRYTWLDGISNQSQVCKPPWFDEPCIRHNLQEIVG